MGSRGALEVLRRRWKWVVAIAVVGMLASLTFSLLSTKTYRASASVFFSLQHGDTASDLVQGSTYTQNQVASFARLATTPAVLQPVIDELGLDVSPQQLAGRVEASAPLNTVIVEVAVTDASPKLSAQLANAIVERLSDTVEGLAPKNATGGVSVEATTVAPAEAPSSPDSPDLVLNLAIGLIAGLLVGFAAGWARQALDTRVHGATTVAELTTLPVIGTIGKQAPTGSRVVVSADPHGPAAETFRQLRTNLQFIGVSGDPESGEAGVRTLLITSSVSAEGKSTIAANLAVALAETSASVILVDADLRRPAVAGILGLEGAAGLTTALIGRATLDDVVQEWGSAGLRVLTAGPLPPNPSQLLGSPAMTRLVQTLQKDYDYVVIDAPPVLPVADAAILSRLVEGTIVVANVTKVRRNQLAESLDDLDHVNARTLGVVLNQVDRDDSAYSYRRNDGDAVWPIDDGHVGSVAAEGPAANAHAAGMPVHGKPHAIRDETQDHSLAVSEGAVRSVGHGDDELQVRR
jgi:capsular exopolysaccharide synthesis family protein